MVCCRCLNHLNNSSYFGILLHHTPQSVTTNFTAQTSIPKNCLWCWLSPHIQSAAPCILIGHHCNYSCVDAALLSNAAALCRAPLGRMGKCRKWRRKGEKWMKMERRCENVITWEKCDRGGRREWAFSEQPMCSPWCWNHKDSWGWHQNCPWSCMFSVVSVTAAQITKI